MSRPEQLVSGMSASRGGGSECPLGKIQPPARGGHVESDVRLRREIVERDDVIPGGSRLMTAVVAAEPERGERVGARRLPAIFEGRAA